MEFKKGDKVEVIDDVIRGVVIAVDKDTVSIETEEGFVMKLNPAELMKVQGDMLDVSNYQVAKALAEKEKGIKKRKVSVKQEKVLPPVEIDIHINQLVKSTKGMTNHDMLNIQLEAAKRHLEFAIRNRIPKIVIIHGVGEGVLRAELEYLFGRYDNISYYDADYRKYGLGATEVYIYQNPS